MFAINTGAVTRLGLLPSQSSLPTPFSLAFVRSGPWSLCVHRLAIPRALTGFLDCSRRQNLHLHPLLLLHGPTSVPSFFGFQFMLTFYASLLQLSSRNSQRPQVYPWCRRRNSYHKRESVAFPAGVPAQEHLTLDGIEGPSLSRPPTSLLIIPSMNVASQHLHQDRHHARVQ